MNVVYSVTSIVRVLSVCRLSVCRLSVTIVNCCRKVRDRHMVTMKHLRQDDIGISESAINFDRGWPWRGHFKVTKVKMVRIVLTVAPRPRVPIDKNVHHCQINKINKLINKNASWPLTFVDLYGSFQGRESKNREDWFGAMSRPSKQQLGVL